MKVFLVKLLIIGCLFAVPVGVSVSYDNLFLPNNHNAIKLNNLNEFDSLDILFVGNSYTYSSIISDTFESSGFQVFNLGVSSAGVDYYELITDSYLANNNKKPKVIAMMVSPMSFVSSANNWTNYPIHRYLLQPISNLHIWKKYHLGNDIFTLTRNSSLKGIRNLFNVAINKSQPIIDYSILNRRGFYLSETTFNEKIVTQSEYLYHSLVHEVFNLNEAKRILEVAKKYKSDGIKVIFHDCPTNMLLNYFSENYITSYNEFVSNIPKYGFDFIHMDLDLGVKCYRNIDHMNLNGAKVYTPLLRDELLRVIKK